MYARQILPLLRNRAKLLPVVTVTGPRQSGKTTICRETFPDKPYVNLEQPDIREFAITDPRGFLSQFPDGAVLDEIQRTPDLLSWIQVNVDEKPAPGRFILTGSQQLELANGISQSLAGRTTLLKLLPLSIRELCQNKKMRAKTIDDFLYFGGYPRIHAQNISPAIVLADYFETYIQRDLRSLMQIHNLSDFQRFVKISAGRIGQILSLQGLAGDVGISSHTASSWMSLLEMSYIVFRLPPWFSNVGKRLIKSPKLYFYDVGLAAWLLGIRKKEHLETHPLRGNLFENLMVLEALKHFYNNGTDSNLYFYRDSSGREVDLVLDAGNSITMAEIKSTQTVSAQMLKPIEAIQKMLGDRLQKSALICGVEASQTRSAFDVVSYLSLSEWLEKNAF